MSIVLKNIVENNLQKSISNYEDVKLPFYTDEELIRELSKGEKILVLENQLDSLKGTIEKSEDSNIKNQLDNIEKICVRSQGKDFNAYLMDVYK